MFFQIAITLMLLLLFIGLMVWFFNTKNAMGRLHNQNVSILESAICNNRNQINFRNSKLNRYDFLKYNLEESLVLQPEILILKKGHYD
jgi:hypothetical protein